MIYSLPDLTHTSVLYFKGHAMPIAICVKEVFGEYFIEYVP